MLLKLLCWDIFEGYPEEHEGACSQKRETKNSTENVPPWKLTCHSSYENLSNWNMANNVQRYLLKIFLFRKNYIRSCFRAI